MSLGMSLTKQTRFIHSSVMQPNHVILPPKFLGLYLKRCKQSVAPLDYAPPRFNLIHSLALRKDAYEPVVSTHLEEHQPSMSQPLQVSNQSMISANQASNLYLQEHRCHNQNCILS